jgi:hypothetical protein
LDRKNNVAVPNVEYGWNWSYPNEREGENEL